VSRFSEDLPALARHAFELANRRCDSCRDYHALRPYLRLAKIVDGPTAHGPAIAEHLDKLLARHDCRVLLAGAGDAGTLAFVASTAAHGNYRVTVLDRCPTPLELCRNFAGRWNIPVEIRQQNLDALDDANSFDAIIGHAVLGFVAPDRRVDLIRRLGASLRDEGKLFLVYRSGRVLDAERHALEEEYSRRVMQGLDLGAVQLPEPRAEFLSRLQRYAHSYFDRRAGEDEPDRVVATVREAGLTVEAHSFVGARPNLPRIAAKDTYLIVASRSAGP
jgi:SAM-dependent methyltransferase